MSDCEVKIRWSSNCSECGRLVVQEAMVEQWMAMQVAGRTPTAEVCPCGGEVELGQTTIFWRAPRWGTVEENEEVRWVLELTGLDR